MSHRIIEYALPAKISLSKLRHHLKSDCSCQSETIVNLERHYQDSFDCRLYKNGYEYYVEKSCGQINIFLKSVNSIKHIHMLSVNEMPVFSHDFKSIIYKRVMHSVLGIRALLSLIVMNIRRHNLVLLNTNNKICAYIQIDEIRMHISDHKNHSMGRYLRILPVKGYENSIQNLLDYLEGGLGLSQSDETLLQKSLAKKKTGYCPLMVFPHHPLRGDMRTDEAIKAVLLSELEIMELNEEGVIKDIDSEFLHDFRVAVRRTRSMLKQIKGIFHKRILDRYNNIFSWVGGITGSLRDIHVYLLKVDDYQKQFPDEISLELEPLKEFLLKHEKIEHEKLVHEFSKRRYQNIKLNWRKFLELPLPAKVYLPNANRSIKHVSDEVIWNAYKKVISYGKKVEDDSPDDKLHRMRINCKKLRYLLEFFADLYPQKQMFVIIKSLKKLQNVLGDFQDLSVQVVTLRKFESQMKEEGMLTVSTLDAMEYLVTYLNELKKGLRDKYIDGYTELCSDKVKNRFSKLFNLDPKII